LDKLYSKYSMPLRVAVVNTGFSNPENFVNRSSRKGEVTDIYDPEGSWMNAGVGGESNTIDLSLELQDATGVKVDKCDIIPIKLRLWTCENGYVVGDALDSVTQEIKQDKSGHRRSEMLMVSGKASSAMHILHSGTGLVCIRITTTSQLNERRRFTVEVTPDLSPKHPNSAKLALLFAGGKTQCKAGDTTLHNCSLSKPMEVMSKINKLAKKRENHCAVHQAGVHLEKALKLLQEGKTNNKAKKVPELLQMCIYIRDILCKGNHQKMEHQDDIPPDVIEDLRRPLDDSNDIGILDLAQAEADQFQEMVNNYRDDSTVVDCLYTHKDMYVTLDHHGHGKFARGHNPFELMSPSKVINGNGMKAEYTAQNVQPSPHQPQGSGEHHYQILKIPFASHAAQDIVTNAEAATSPGGHHHFDPRAFMSSLHEREDKLKTLFDSIDTNGDGFISYDELLKARDNDMLKGSDEDIEAMHRWMDREREDGLVDFMEFRFAMTLLPASTTLETLISNFRVHEKNEIAKSKRPRDWKANEYAQSKMVKIGYK